MLGTTFYIFKTSNIIFFAQLINVLILSYARILSLKASDEIVSNVLA